MFPEKPNWADPDCDAVSGGVPGSPHDPPPGRSPSPGLLPAGPGGDDVWAGESGGGQSGAQYCLGDQAQQPTVMADLTPLDTGAYNEIFLFIFGQSLL